MLLPQGHHLAYCTNIHPAESWPECLAALESYTLAVRERVCPTKPYAIGLRLSDLASRQLSVPGEISQFRRWLDQHNCYVFTINGFPFGQFHGTRVKEQVYRPDWTTPERLEYTNRLFDILARLLPEGVAGSVSTLPGSFKEFITTPEQLAAICRNLRVCVKHIAETASRSRRELHLGLEPEPLGLLETTQETVNFFDRLREEDSRDQRLEECLGVNYDTCHLAVEFEEPAEALALLQSHRVKISKIHLSNALKIAGKASPPSELAAFADDTYLHQVITRDNSGGLTRFRDLTDFLNPQSAIYNPQSGESRIHFHIPLQTQPGAWFETTSDHLLGALDVLQKEPTLCSHLEMETYTWGVLPPELKSRSVTDQLVAEYGWCLNELRRRGLA
jgi:sugar phosphate isomerase/epimerase